MFFGCDLANNLYTLLAAAVEFEHGSYTVTEGDDEFVELIVKAENVEIFLALNVSLNQDSAEGS